MKPDLPRRIEKPWGHEILFALTRNYAGKVLFVKKGYRLSLQFHREKEETMYLFSGRIRMEVGSGAESKESIFEPGDAIDLPPGTVHRVEALEDSFIMEVSTPYLDDVVRIEDDYGRLP